MKISIKMVKLVFTKSGHHKKIPQKGKRTITKVNITFKFSARVTVQPTITEKTTGFHVRSFVAKTTKTLTMLSILNKSAMYDKDSRAAGPRRRRPVDRTVLPQRPAARLR